MERGDVYTIIYLKMQLASLRNNGVLVFDGFEDTFAEELADELDEDVADVSATVDFLIRHGLLVQLEEGNKNYLPEVVKNAGSEGASARRMRELRQQENGKSSQCDGTE